MRYTDTDTDTVILAHPYVECETGNTFNVRKLKSDAKLAIFGWSLTDERLC